MIKRRQIETKRKENLSAREAGNDKEKADRDEEWENLSAREAENDKEKADRKGCKY